MRAKLILLTLFSTLLSGCASVIQSEVTAFHEWPQDSSTTSFVFEPPAASDQELEVRHVEGLIRKELIRIGLHEPAEGEKPQLKVSFSTSLRGRDMHVIETVMVDSWYGTPWYGPGFYHPYLGRPGWGYPYYGPMWPSMPVAREVERRYTVFHRELKIKMNDLASGHALYEVTVKSDGKEGNLAKVMPYLVKSAFTEFPGKSGTPKIIKLKIEE